ncbi:MAG: hypothetical protein PHH14_07400 [Candidatus Margulisbacteria bacterium]|nr:hypothetical protein [Candidatus Margulisiibacteriota bacterium]
MQISKVRTIGEIYGLFLEKDSNHNGRLEQGEISVAEIRSSDGNADGSLSAWEVMTAVNKINQKQIFTADKIEETKKNEKSGSLPVLTLEAETVIGGVTLPAGTKVSFEEFGGYAAAITSDTTIKGVKYQAGTRLEIYANGSVRCGTLAENTLIKLAGNTFVRGVRYKARTVIEYYPNGKVKKGKLSGESAVDGLRFTGNEEIGSGLISFYEDGRVERGYLARDTKLGGITFGRNTLIEFYPDGKVHIGRLRKSANIQGKQYQAGEFRYRPNLFGLNYEMEFVGGEIEISEQGEVKPYKTLEGTMFFAR